MRQKEQIPPSFTAKKNIILSSLSTSDSAYTDLSPKGSVDAAIKPLINRINALEGVVTTSSCAGRVTVFLEGRKAGYSSEKGRDARNDERNGKEPEQAAVPGGKGMGGKWLFVCHEPVELPKKGGDKDSLAQFLCLGSSGAQDEAQILNGDVNKLRLVRFQFEPMVRRDFSNGRTDLLAIFIVSAMLLQMLRRDVDPPHHDSFPTPRPAHSRCGHQCWISGKWNSESQELGGPQCISDGCNSKLWSGF